MSPRLTLLATLDAALADGSDAAAGATGLAAATRLNDLLVRQRLGWEDVVTADSRLAKLCGHLGSEFPGERAAAYDHAVRVIRSRGATWSDLVHLPEALRNATAPEPGSVDLAVPTITAADGAPAPPDGDWATTIQRLVRREAWHTAAEQALLRSVARRLAKGGPPITSEEAVAIREIWWDADLETRYDEELWEQELGPT